MTISQKAKEYAEGKALNALTSAIESAYAEGYNAGYNDALASKPDEKPEDLDDGVEYVDLGLPSGTKWAADYLKDKDGEILYLTYGEAAKLRIPTQEQFDELVQYCAKNYQEIKNKAIALWSIIGLNGNYVNYNLKYFVKGGQLGDCKSVRFWLIDKDIKDKDNSRSIATVDNKSGISYEFMGYRLPVILVR